MKYLLQPFRRITKDDNNCYGEKEHYQNSVHKKVNLTQLFPQNCQIPIQLGIKYKFDPKEVRLWGVRSNSVTDSVYKKVNSGWGKDDYEVYFTLDNPVNKYFHGKLLSPLIPTPKCMNTGKIWPVHKFTNVTYDYIYFFEEINEYENPKYLLKSDLMGKSFPTPVIGLTLV